MLRMFTRLLPLLVTRPPMRAAPAVCRQKGTAPSRSIKYQLGQYMRRMGKQEHLGTEGPGCEECLRLLDEMRAQDLPVRADALNAAMRACVGRVDVVEGIFAGLAETGSETEGSYAALMQARVEQGELERAAAALDALLLDARLRPKLRTCGPLLQRLCDADDARDVLRLWERLARRGVEFTPREYEARLRMHGRAADAAQLQACLAELLARYPTPDAAAIAAITQSVGECSAGAAAAATAATAGDGGAPAVRRLTTQQLGSALRLLGLTAEEREAVRDELLDRASRRSASGFEHLQTYREWLRVRPPFDYVLDGPNVAYFHQNYEGGRFSYEQIEAVIDNIKAAEPDARVLLLLPQKYLRREIPNHTCSKTRSNQVSDADWSRIRAWHEAGMLYACSSALYDDWYWMYATVAETQAEEPLADGASPTRVVTNDCMRDHWCELLPALAFARWRHSQVAAFGFEVDGEEAAAEGERRVAEAEKVEKAWVSAAAQRRSVFGRAAGGAPASPLETGGRTPGDPWVAPMPMLSLEAQQSLDGRAWHVPVLEGHGEDAAADPRRNAAPQVEWLCFDAPA